MIRILAVLAAPEEAAQPRSNAAPVEVAQRTRREARPRTEEAPRARRAAPEARPPVEEAPRARRAVAPVEAPQPRRVTAEVRAPFERPHRDENRRHRRYEDDDVPVVGLGDHVPSFLLRPVRLKPLKPGKELAAAED